MEGEVWHFRTSSRPAEVRAKFESRMASLPWSGRPGGRDAARHATHDRRRMLEAYRAYRSRVERVHRATWGSAGVDYQHGEGCGKVRGPQYSCGVHEHALGLSEQGVDREHQRDRVR